MGEEDRVPTCTSRILEGRSGGQVGLSCSEIAEGQSDIPGDFYFSSPKIAGLALVSWRLCGSAAEQMVRLLCVASLLGYASAGWTGALGLTFESNKPVEAKSLFCPSGFITGIRVKYGRTRDEDRDLYDFKLKCGQRWTSWSGLWFKNELEDKTYECPAKMYVTGIEVC